MMATLGASLMGGLLIGAITYFFARLISPKQRRRRKPRKTCVDDILSTQNLDPVESIRCDNCGHIEKHRRKVSFVCSRCGFTRCYTMQEICGRGSSHERPSILANPSPIQTHFGTDLEPFEKCFNIDRSRIDAGLYSKLDDSLKAIRSSDKAMYATGLCPIPRPYKDIAVIARKSKYYELEIAICNRASDVAKIHDKIVDTGGRQVLRFSQTSAADVIERTPKAKALLERQKHAQVKEQNKKDNIGSKRKATENNTIQTETRVCRRRKSNKATLEEQCANCDIDIINMDIRYEDKQYVFEDGKKIKRVEESVLWHLMSKCGYEGGTFYELHPVMQIIQGACLDYLADKSQDVFLEDYMARTFNVQVEMYNLDVDTVVRLFRSKTKEELFEGWKKLYSECERLQEWFPNIDECGVKSLVNIMPDEIFEKIIRHIFLDPQNNSIGWPDIFAVKGGELNLFEVKVNDTLRDSQINTYKKAICPMGLTSKVIKVRRLSE